MTNAQVPAFEPEELSHLHALRRAAAEIFNSTVIRAGGDIGVSISARTGEPVSISRRGHDSERFRSFMIALRRTYAQNDGANFLRSLNILSKWCEERRPHLKRLRDSYLAVLRSKEIEIDGMGHEAIFEAWLYGSVFHDDDAELRKRWEGISGNPLIGAVANMIVESTAVQLAHYVLALDDIIAEVLGEEPLPQLEENQSGSRPADPLPAAFVRATVRPHRQRGTLWIDFTNEGEGEARNVTLDAFKPLNDGDEDVLISGEAERKFPVPKLRPRESVSLMAAPTMGTPTEFEVVVAWDDPSGQRRREDFRIDLLAV